MCEWGGVEEERSARKCCCMKKGGNKRCDEQVSVHKESTGAALTHTTDTHTYTQIVSQVQRLVRPCDEAAPPRQK